MKPLWDDVYLLSSSANLWFQNPLKCFWAPASLICEESTKVSEQKSPSRNHTACAKYGNSSKTSTHLLDLSGRQLKSHSAQVIAETLLLARRRDRHDVLIDAPAQADLAGVDGVLLRQLREDIVHGAAGGFGHGGLGTVGREGDVLRGSVKCCGLV